MHPPTSCALSSRGTQRPESTATVHAVRERHNPVVASQEVGLCLTRRRAGSQGRGRARRARVGAQVRSTGPANSVAERRNPGDLKTSDPVCSPHSPLAAQPCIADGYRTSIDDCSPEKSMRLGTAWSNSHCRKPAEPWFWNAVLGRHHTKPSARAEEIARTADRRTCRGLDPLREPSYPPAGSR